MVRTNGFLGYVKANDRRSAALFVVFLLAFHIAAAAALYLPLALCDPAHALFGNWRGYGTRYVPLLTLAGVTLFALQLLWHVASVRTRLDVRIVGRRDEPRLYRLVETLAVTMGLPMPELGLLESPALNSFACGLNRSNAMLVVTRGLIDTLDEAELAGVVAHELVHIRNGDIRLMAAANILQRDLFWVFRLNRLRIGEAGQVILIVLMAPMLLPLLVIGGLVSESAFRLGLVSRFLIASAREFIADAEAVQVTQNPEALISALRKIDGRSKVADLPSEMDAMMVDGATTGAAATHPMIADRIAALTALVARVPAVRLSANPQPVFGRRGVVSPAPRLVLSPKPAAFSPQTAIDALQRVSEDSERSMFGFAKPLGLVVLLALIASLAVSSLLNVNAITGRAMRPTLQSVNEVLDQAALMADRGMRESQPPRR